VNYPKIVVAMAPARVFRHAAAVPPPRANFRVRARSGRIGEFGPPPPPVPDIDSDSAGAYDLAEDGKPMWLKCASCANLLLFPGEHVW
jgi:hypothetical protein